MKTIYVTDDIHEELKKRAKKMNIKLYELCDLIFTTALEGLNNEDNKDQQE